jgi:signal transduction histidine kinase
MNTRHRLSHSFLSFKALFDRGIHFIYRRCIAPRSDTEDEKRHEFILNTILCGIIPLLIILDTFIAHAALEQRNAYQGVPFPIFSFIVILFVYLLILSRNTYHRLASFILIGLYFISTTYGAIHWGIELPLVAISYVVIIVISSILISTRFGFFVTSTITLTIIAICELQLHQIVHPSLQWKYASISIHDPIQLSVIFFLITIISWLSNREMERSLIRARASEHLLVEERNLLEIKVEERTKELKEVQHDKVAQLYRVAEFGRISAGVFHDLMNSLQVVVSNISQVEAGPEHLPEVRLQLAKTVAASKRMGRYIDTVRKQIRNDDTLAAEFSVEKEITDAMDMLQFHARKANVSLHFIKKHSLILHGNPLKFYQAILNLLANAIDACDDNDKQGQIDIILQSHIQNTHAVVIIRDNGCGIPVDVLDHIFDQFFTTKGAHKGIGLGLSQTKEIIEKEFKGTITVTSEEYRGTTFTITLPIIHDTIQLSAGAAIPALTTT